jgi:hypothetical protein
MPPHIMQRTRILYFDGVEILTMAAGVLVVVAIALFF